MIRWVDFLVLVLVVYLVVCLMSWTHLHSCFDFKNLCFSVIEKLHDTYYLRKILCARYAVPQSKYNQWLCYLTTFLLCQKHMVCVSMWVANSVCFCLHIRCEVSVGSISRRLLLLLLHHWHQIDQIVCVCVCVHVDKSKKWGVRYISGSTECYKLSAGISHPPYDAT